MTGTINKGEIIPLTFDIMFTEIFNNEDCICILEEFIAGYFNYPLESVRGNLEICYTRDEYENYLASWCKILTEIKENKLKDLSKQVLSNNSKNILMKKVNKLSGDDEMVRLYTKLSKRELEFNTLKNEAREEGFTEGHAEGHAEGLAEGINEGTRNVALNMLNEDISISMISRCTGLSEEEIKK